MMLGFALYSWSGGGETALRNLMSENIILAVNVGVGTADLCTDALAFVDDLVSGHKKLSNEFFKKMTHNLATWRLRRAVSAVRCALIIS